MQKKPILLSGLLLIVAPLLACGGGGGSPPRPACNNTCQLQGTTQCSGPQVQTCTADANGCLAWSAAVACGTGQTCFASANKCQNDPCNAVQLTGRCADPQTIELCRTATGQGSPGLYTYRCPLGQVCSTQTGSATCQNTGSCTPGTTVCLDSTHLQTCNAGSPVTTMCANTCLTTVLGGICTSPLSTRNVTFTAKYTLRGPNPNYTDWSTTTTDVTVSDLLVLSYRGTDLIDARTTDANGGVTIQVPVSPQSGDIIALATAASDGAGGLAFIVADPGFASPGLQPIASVGTPHFWVWSAATSSISDGGTLTITENMGSGALRVFDYLRYVYYRSRALEGGFPGRSLVVWLGYGTSWTCGSCFAPIPTVVSNLLFDSEIWLNGDNNMEYWSDAVTAHELGHWVMASYGTSPGEGGTHVLGVPSFPGLAWSEGWATWHSSNTRQSSIYFDKQGGSMFWLDISSDRYSTGVPWRLPTPAAGLLQLMDENEVSSILWSISSASTVGTQPLFAALAGAHMNTAPWGRGYTRHIWQLDSTGNPTNVVDTGSPAPTIPDFLDALNCAGVSRSVIDAATIPGTQYPYPSATPICP